MSTDTIPVSREDYLAGERAATETRAEWVDGEIREMTGASYAHIVIVQNIAVLLGTALRERPIVALLNDMKVRIADGPYYYPDVVVTPDPPTFEDARRDIVLDPLVVVEVLSPSTEAVDRGEKLDNYRSIPTLTDYVLVEQDEPRVDHYVRRDDVWQLDVHRDLEATVRLTTINAELPLRAIYERILEV